MTERMCTKPKSVSFFEFLVDLFNFLSDVEHYFLFDCRIPIADPITKEKNNYYIILYSPEMLLFRIRLEKFVSSTESKTIPTSENLKTFAHGQVACAVSGCSSVKVINADFDETMKLDDGQLYACNKIKALTTNPHGKSYQRASRSNRQEKLERKSPKSVKRSPSTCKISVQVAAAATEALISPRKTHHL